LTTSEHSARILSIHAAKGQGREVVFVVGFSALKFEILLHGKKDDLKLHSLIHVALTR
jgi:ATP-dependent exoDNAse (exonuclease V) beta subunit